MRPNLFLLLLGALLVAFVASADDKTPGAGDSAQWVVGGTIEKIKSYGDTEPNGFVLRFDVRRPNGKTKKLYLRKDVGFYDSKGETRIREDFKVGTAVVVHYDLEGDQFVAKKVTLT
jgi:hypothetical protein